jgi:hypothetical protein
MQLTTARATSVLFVNWYHLLLYVHRICGQSGQSWRWQSSAIQAFQMIIELVLLPVVVTSIRLSLHRTSTTVTNEWKENQSIPAPLVVGIQSSDIQLATRLCWTHRMPPLLRQCTQSINLSGIPTQYDDAEPAKLVERHRDLYDDTALHGVLTPEWTWETRIHKNKMGREAPLVAADIASFLGFDRRQKLRVPYNLMFTKVSQVSTEFKHVSQSYRQIVCSNVLIVIVFVSFCFRISHGNHHLSPCYQ